MASVGLLIGGALISALAFSSSNFLFSSLSKNQLIGSKRGMIKLLSICNKLK